MKKNCQCNFTIPSLLVECRACLLETNLLLRLSHLTLSAICGAAKLMTLLTPPKGFLKLSS